MRSLLLLLPLLAAAGCGSSSTDVSSAPGLPDQRVPITAATGLQVSATLLNAAEADQGGTEVLNPGQALFTNVDLPHPASTAEAVAAAYGALLARGSTVANGTRGGSYQSIVTGSFVTLIFQNFGTAQGTLSGNVSYQGTASNTAYFSQATMTGLRVTPVNGTAYGLDGGAAYNSTASSASTSTNQFRTVATATDTNGGIVRYSDYGANSEIRLEGSTVSGSVAYLGRFTLANYRGLTGHVDVSTPQVQTFTGSTLQTGQLVFVGNGTSRLTVVSPGQVEVAVSPGEGQPFQTIQVVPYTSL